MNVSCRDRLLYMGGFWLGIDGWMLWMVSIARSVHRGTPAIPARNKQIYHSKVLIHHTVLRFGLLSQNNQPTYLSQSQPPPFHSTGYTNINVTKSPHLPHNPPVWTPLILLYSSLHNPPIHLSITPPIPTAAPKTSQTHGILLNSDVPMREPGRMVTDSSCN